MLSNHPQTEVFHGSAIQNNAQPNTAEHYLSVCAQLKYVCKAGRTQTNNAQLYLAQPFIKRLSQEKLLSAGDC